MVEKKTHFEQKAKELEQKLYESQELVEAYKSKVNYLESKFEDIKTESNINLEISKYLQNQA